MRSVRVIMLARNLATNAQMQPQKEAQNSVRTASAEPPSPPVPPLAPERKYINWRAMAFGITAGIIGGGYAQHTHSACF
jgi:hypothetical protein